VDPFEKYVQQMQAAAAGDGLKARKEKNGIVVLDCFAGIGTAIVVLKKLGIKIRKVIHVEHDKISTHVYRHNHDRQYNLELPEDGGIEHVFYSAFEELENNEQLLLDKHGRKCSPGVSRFPTYTFASHTVVTICALLSSFVPYVSAIDLIIGGPPCIDYSPVNARRKGADGEQGSYMVRFGMFIRTLERLQREDMPRCKLFFLVENVVLTGDDLEQVCDAFGLEWDPIELDAQCK
jgi:site-specific DNA-cytosine methylase